MRKLLLLTLIFIISFSTYSQVMFVATLSGAQEVPPVSTPATATAYFVLNADSSWLSYRITYAKLQGEFVAGFFHEGTAGTSGNVIQDIPFFERNTTARVWKNIPPSVITKLLNEDIYVSIHSSQYPNGEIRGQLRRVNGYGFTASLFGGQEIPPVTTNAEGTAFILIANKGSEIKYSVTVAGLTSSITQAQICNAAFGSVGSVIQSVSFNDSCASGSITSCSDSILTELLRNRLYINVKTSQYPDGEIRAQFFRQGEVMFKLSMDASQETPPGTSPAKATGWAILSANLARLRYSIAFTNLSTPLASAAFYHGLPGQEGFLINNIGFTGNQVNYTREGVPDSLIRFLLKGEVYVNLNSTGKPNGEIRGQLEQTSGLGYTSMLNSLQPIPPASSLAVGTGWIDYGRSGSEIDTATYQFTLANLSSPITGAGFYNAAYGSGGALVQPITYTENTASGKWMITDQSLLYQLFKGFLYTNISTSNFPDGEIRGQVYYFGVAAGSVNNIEDKYIGSPEGFSLSQNYPNPFNPTTKIRYSISSDEYVRLRVYNVIGEQVAILVNKEVKAGSYEINWNAGNLSSGIYFYSLEAGQNSIVKKMILLR